MIGAGKRDRYIAFQLGVQSQSGSGEPTLDWTGPAYFQCWAERTDLTGAELFHAQQLVAKADVRYRIPYPHGVSVTPRAELRISDQGRLYDIKHVAELGTRGREGLEILAEGRAE